jgi:transposase
LSTKIHATVDALGNPTGFHLTGGQEHDLEGADALLPELEAETLIADKAFDADAGARAFSRGQQDSRDPTSEYPEDTARL